jgi:hypothetical protein
MSKRVFIKFYSMKLLLTVDLNGLVHSLQREFGQDLEINFAPMTQSEKGEASEDVSGIEKVNDRLIVLVDMERRQDLENSIRSI